MSQQVQRYVFQHPQNPTFFRMEGWTTEAKDAIQFTTFQDAERFQEQTPQVQGAAIVPYTPAIINRDPQARTDYDPFGFNRFQE